jgi:hypothetical protein
MGVNLVGRLAEVDGTRLAFAGDVNDFVAFGDQVAVTLEGRRRPSPLRASTPLTGAGRRPRAVDARTGRRST